MDRNEIEKDLSINKNQLDQEWVVHPSNVLKYGEMAVQAEESLERIELKKDTIIAQLDDQIRSTGTKMTVDGIKNWIVRQPIYQQVQEELIRAQYELNMLKVVNRALDHKRKGLEKLVDLYLSSYYSEPRHQMSERMISDRIDAELSKVMPTQSEVQS